ncbi:MAG TPA: hypothetical protein VE866_16005, partial [Candidatus Binatia bacterium]|nr:hypothetical protein [Candidatus Binatia bacterium]
VADASGVAAAQLVGNQLVYRAGSGSAASFIGRQVTAVLSASAPGETRAEILRVENAQDDSRIEAEVCRLYGANALLIVPIYRKHAVAGVLEILFSEPHTFADRELLTYRIMARLIEDAMSVDVLLHAKNLEQKKAAAQVTAFSPVLEPIASPVLPLHGNDGSTVPPEMRLALSKLRWNVAAASLAALLLMVAGLAYHHRLVSHANTASSSKSTPEQAQVTAKPSLASNGAYQVEASTSANAATATPGSGFRRVRIDQDEVDYISDDVTIRRFTSNTPGMLAGERLVNFGQDVTVRYFGSKSEVSPQIQPVPAAERSVER